MDVVREKTESLGGRQTSRISVDSEKEKWKKWKSEKPEREARKLKVSEDIYKSRLPLTPWCRPILVGDDGKRPAGWLT